MRGIERRIAAGLDPRISSVASLFVSRWDRAVADKVPQELRNRLGIAIAARTYRAHSELLASKRWRDLEAAGARKQRMLWASTGTKDPKAAPGLYVEALAAPDTIDTMPEKTLLAFAVGGKRQVRDAEGRRRRRAGAGAFCRGRHRCRRARRPLAGGRGAVLRQILDRTHEAHRRQERGAGNALESEDQSPRRPARARRFAGGRTAAHHRLLQRTAGSRCSRRNESPSAPPAIAAARST